MKRFKNDNVSGFVIGAVHSGSGKTVITLGIMEALKRRGFALQPFKAGPDYIDPGHHGALLGTPSYNLDTWMMGSAGVRKTFHEKSVGKGRVGVIEGVMGLYDGRDGVSEEGSSAHLSKVLSLPVLLIVDSSGMSRSAGAVVKGFEAYDPGLDLRWVVFNRVGSDRHAKSLVDSIPAGSSVDLLGCVPKDARLIMPGRHLGLVTSDDLGRSKWLELTDAACGLVEEHLDLDRLCACLALKGAARGKSDEARRQPETSRRSIRLIAVPGADETSPAKERPLIAVARDRAFCFYYEENLEILRDSGAELVFFSPLKDKRLPPGISGIYIGGGYPELYARRLEANTSMRKAVKDACEAGLGVYAECGGLMYLGSSIECAAGRRYSMAGVFPWYSRMSKRRKALGYREVSVAKGFPMLRSGGALRGHEFHYSEVVSVPPRHSGLKPAFAVKGPKGTVKEGFRLRNTVATYVHLHFASNPCFAKGFVDLCSLVMKGNASRKAF